MKIFILTLFTLLSFNSFAGNDIDYKRVLNKASYENCRISVRNGKITTRNCKAEDKKNDVVREAEWEIERAVNRKIDKTLDKIFKW
tara:strand:- start:9269 stop:9526 length:258 start_codon:yes stop_codon:yes gene_type:complete